MLEKVREDWVSVAKIGRTIGFRGEVVLHLFSDFPESLKKGSIYLTRLGEFRLEYYRIKDSVAKFYGIDFKEEAKTLTNLVLYTTKEQSIKQCKLKEDEFFWFEIIGSKIVENGEILGLVSEVSRFCNQDYLSIETDLELLKHKLPKSFLIPYTARYILEVDCAHNPKIIRTQFCKEILENS